MNIWYYTLVLDLGGREMFKNMDLTKGTIWKSIILFSLPIFLSYLFQQLYNITDAAICGFFLTGDEVAGINNTGSLNFMILQFAFGCMAGFSVVTANAIGKKDIEESRKSLLCQMLLAGIISILLTLIALLSLNTLLSFLGITKESNINIYEASYTYTFIIFLGCFTQVFYNLAVCFLRALGDSKMPLIFLIASAILNVFLDFLFIAGIKMGVAGAALATVISQLVSAVGCYIYIFVKLKEYRFKKADFKFARGFIFRHLKLGLPLGLQSSILAIGLIMMQGTMIKFDLRADGSLGNEVQLGYSTACKLSSFFATPYNALGTAMISYVGQNYGANELARIRKGILQVSIISLLMFVVLTSIGLLLTIDGVYMRVFLGPEKITPAVIKYGNLYLYCALPFHLFLCGIFLYRNALQGIERPLFPFIAGVVELIARMLVCLFLPTMINGGPINNMANDASYIAFCFADNLSWLFAAITLLIGLILFFRGIKNEKNDSLLKEAI